MKYALNLAEDGRILSVWEVLPDGDYDGMPIVEELPEDNVADYRYVEGNFVYEPQNIPQMEEKPTQMDRLEAQLIYTAMMTDTLLEV